MAEGAPHTARGLSVLGLAFNALVWGLSWWPLRTLHEFGVHPLWATALVYGAVLLAMGLWRPSMLGSMRSHRGLWWLALASGLTNVCFNWAVTLGDVVRVVLLFYLMPAWSVLLAWALLGERPSLGAVMRLLLALAGVTLVLKPVDSPWPVPEGLADGLALAGGLSFALTNVLLRRLRDTPGESRALAMFGGGTVTALLVALATQGGAAVLALQAAPLSQWLPVAFGLATAFLLGNLALQYGAARLPAQVTALVMLSEVVFASLSSVALGAAELSARTLAGGALVMLAATLAAWPRAR
ncbi:MAG: DMT family transporter [Tibeticola sp.]